MTQELFYQGKSATITLPSGRKVTIRETNGDDEGLLSENSSQEDGTFLGRYLAAIITSKNPDTNELYTYEDIMKWGLRDITYLSLKSRCHSLGTQLVFDHTCRNPKCNHKMEKVEEDLTIFDDDLSKPLETPTNPYQITPYPHKEAKIIEFKTSSGKKLRFKILDGNSMKDMLETVEGTSNRNADFLIRDLEIYNADKWQKVTRFSMFSSREMQEIRGKVRYSDKPFEPTMALTCPVCNTPQLIPVLSVGDFFFPAVM